MSKKDQDPVKDPECLMEFWKAVNSSQKKDDSTEEHFKNKNGIIKDGEEIIFYYGGENNDFNIAFLKEGVMKNIDGGWDVVDQYDAYHAYPD
ncbi:MAG: hypothetical protein PHO23_01770, partial [Candidatus Pacebacteria bacterium]|nr:hypothetical protein [Candidatus Paceibacterota bacterium]